MEVSVRELKNRLSEYLRRVAAGESVVVTSHGRIVARLMPPHPVDSTGAAAAVRRFRGLVWIRPGNGKRPDLPEPVLRLGRRAKTLADIVSDQRG